MKIPFEDDMCLPIIPNEESFAVLSNINYEEVTFLMDDVPDDNLTIKPISD